MRGWIALNKASTKFPLLSFILIISTSREFTNWTHFRIHNSQLPKIHTILFWFLFFRCRFRWNYTTIRSNYNAYTVNFPKTELNQQRNYRIAKFFWMTLGIHIYPLVWIVGFSLDYFFPSMSHTFWDKLWLARQVSWSFHSKYPFPLLEKMLQLNVETLISFVMLTMYEWWPW